MPTPRGKINVNETALIWEHDSKIKAMEVDLKAVKDLVGATPVILTKLEYIAQTIGEIKDYNKEIDNRVTSAEKDIATTKERVGQFAIFNGLLSVVAGAIATAIKGFGL